MVDDRCHAPIVVLLLATGAEKSSAFKHPTCTLECVSAESGISAESHGGKHTLTLFVPGVAAVASPKSANWEKVNFGRR